jgi:SAM-dependent methyltransferase
MAAVPTMSDMARVDHGDLARVVAPRAVGLARAWLCAVGAGLALAAAAQAPAPDTDVPFVVTPDNVTLAMLELAAVGPADHVIDLGSGDGRIVILAARRFGASGLGVEIVDDLVRRSRASAERAGVAGRVEFRTEDLFTTDLSSASVVTMYLLPEVNLQLRPRLLALRPGTRIVSHDYGLGDWMPDRTVVVDAPDKPVGRERISRLHLWVVPARVGGLWCAARPAVALRLHQRYQHVSAEADGVVWRGRIEGPRVSLQAFDGRATVLQAKEDGVLTVESSASGLPAGLRLLPATGDRCPPPAR